MSRPDISFDDLLESYLKQRILRPSSVKNYRNILARLSREKNISLLSEITEDILVSWKNEILERATATTWNNYHTHLRALLNYAVKKEWIDENSLLNIPRAKKPTLKKKTLDLVTLELMFHTLDQNAGIFYPKWFWVAVIKLMFHTGMRQNQLLSLKWRDIDFDKQDLFLSLEGSKTHREWTIPLPKGCTPALLYLKEMTQRKLGPVEIADHPVFRLQLFNDNFSGFGLTNHQLEGFFKKLSKIAGQRISSHRLRHTMASMLAQSGESPDLKSLQYILGHTDIRTTMEYIEPNKAHLEKVLNQLTLNL